MQSSPPPPRLTRKLIARFAELVRLGIDISTAGRYLGIPVTAVKSWLDTSSQQKLHVAFRKSLAKAKSEAEIYAVGLLRKEMAENWRAALAFLERRRPRRWRIGGPRSEKTDPLPPPVNPPLPPCDASELSAVVEELLRAESATADERR